MATSSKYQEVGDYIINMDLDKCLGSTLKVTVHPGKHKTRDTHVAAKRFVWDKDLPTDIVDQEVETMRSTPPHDNVLKLVDYVKIEAAKFKEIWLILELCPLGHLGEFAKTKELTLPQKVDLMLQSAQGVHHLHHLEKPLIHRDLKPANLLLTGDSLHPLVKVADYGESRYFQGSHEHSLRDMTAAGTPYYQAPELFGDSKSNRPAHNKAVDVFALGVSFHNLLGARKGVTSTPIKVNKTVLGLHMHQHPDTDVRELVMNPKDSDDEKEVKNLICEMLVKDPKRRILIGGVLERLRELRTLLGVKVMMAVDTVWGKPVFHLNTDLLDLMKANISSQSPVTTDPKQSPVTTDLPITKVGIRMENAKKVTSASKDVLDGLTRLHVGGDTEDRLLAVSVGDSRGVWMHERNEWVSVSDVPDECPAWAVCMCQVSDGFILCGGCDHVFGLPASQCHHFSVLARQWRKLANMLTPRKYTSAVEYATMKVLVVGGEDSSAKDSVVCEILDCENGEWSPAANMPKPLETPLIAAETGRVFILPRDDNIKQSRLLVYDPLSTKHTYKAKLPKDVHDTDGACLVAASHKLYLLHGVQGLALEYNLDTDQWNPLTPPSLRCYAKGCFATVTSGMIKLYGGGKELGEYITGEEEEYYITEEEDNMVEEYDIHTQKWKTLDIKLPLFFSQWQAFVAHYNI